MINGKKVKFSEKYLFVINSSIIIVSLMIISFFCYILKLSLIIPLILFTLGFYIHNFRKNKLTLFLHLGLLLALIVFIANSILHYTEISIYYTPVACISMLVILLFNDLNLSFVMAFASSLLVTLIVGGDINMFLVFVFGGLTGAYFVRNSRTRSQPIYAGLFVSVMQVICLYLLKGYSVNFVMSEEFSRQLLYPIVASGFLAGFFVQATLKVFEYLFGVLTNYSLLELGDFNHLILKNMSIEAPGTYHHSLIVANIAESAADAISANALLTRVGAYYHDIGKMSKPEYFTENQIMGVNKHDKIEPSMSRLVILNHVKDGIDLARKHKLNQLIIDFIPQHHGTGLIHYFYQKSLESAQDGQVVNEENFRYPGPKPQTKEAAIVLLADSVEGAVRSLDEPNINKIEETVRKIINNKFIDGQLDECNLTLKEIDKISSTFVRILGAMYHTRIKYPEKKNGNTNKQSSEQNTNQQSSTDKDNQDSSD